MACFNKLTIGGNCDLLAWFVKVAQGRPPLYQLSEAERATYEELGELEEMQQEPAEQPLCCHSFVPVPPDVLEQGYHAAGYGFQTRNWGIPHDLLYVELEQSGEETVCYSFWTMDVPPTNAIQTMAERFPALKFDLYAICVPDSRTYQLSWKAGLLIKDEIGEMSDEDYLAWRESAEKQPTTDEKDCGDAPPPVPPENQLDHSAMEPKQ